MNTSFRHKDEPIEKMEQKVRKQPKWHKLMSSVPSIPPKNKQVPEGDDYEPEAPAPQQVQGRSEPSNDMMMATRRAQKGNSNNMFAPNEGTLSGGMQVMSEEDA